MASQATRLGKNSSVTVQDKRVPLRSNWWEHLWARLIIIVFSLFYILKSPVRSLNPNYLPSAYLFAYNCDPSWRLHIPDLHLSPLSLIKGHTPIINYLTFLTPIIALDKKGKNFLDISDNDGNILEPHYKKGGAWLPFVGHSNSTCARLTRLITNHAPIGDYHKIFFPREAFLCPCNSGVIKTRDYILLECNRYNEAWWPPDSSIFSILMFLQGNPNTFCFEDC